MSLRILLIGYGKMGHMVEELAAGAGAEVAGRVDVDNVTGEWPSADVAIDFSTPDAVAPNLARLARAKTNVVIGTTGWHAREAELMAVASDAGIGVVASANFSIGVNLFQLVAAEAGRRFAAHLEYGAWIHEAHHAAKKDAPSGTALLLRDTLVQAGYGRPIDMSSTRAGAIPGVHTIGFDAASDTIELTHTARDRRGFARGALLAAQWVQGRHGWYSMADVLNT
jgi:4-hydroxy-tetrahydrodipicolinate reductase